MSNEFEVEVAPGAGRGRYRVQVIRAASGGEPCGELRLDVDDLLVRRSGVENAVLASAAQARSGVVPEVELPLRRAGEEMFRALFTGPVGETYRASLAVARERGAKLRVVLHLSAPELAALPWEAMWDPEVGAYVCRKEPLVRHVPAPFTPEPLPITLPLRILGLVASPRGLAPLDVERERAHLDEALAAAVADGRVVLEWLAGATWDALQERLLSATWHVLHFIGHGDYDTIRDQGRVALVGEDGRADWVEAGRLVDLLNEADPTPRLVVLNSCSSGQAGTEDAFSGTASALVHGGISAVAAMQFRISDPAAVAFPRGFYRALAAGKGVDAAVSSGRIAILGRGESLEWVTPVLYVRGDSTLLFRVPTAEPAPGPGPGAGPAGGMPAATVAVPAVIGPARAPAGPAPAGVGSRDDVVEAERVPAEVVGERPAVAGPAASGSALPASSPRALQEPAARAGGRRLAVLAAVLGVVLMGVVAAVLLLGPDGTGSDGALSSEDPSAQSSGAGTSLAESTPPEVAPSPEDAWAAANASFEDYRATQAGDYWSPLIPGPGGNSAIAVLYDGDSLALHQYIDGQWSAVDSEQVGAVDDVTFVPYGLTGGGEYDLFVRVVDDGNWYGAALLNDGNRVVFADGLAQDVWVEGLDVVGDELGTPSMVFVGMLDHVTALIWPRFPGVSALGDEGEAVMAWQDILIRAQVLADEKANRDGVYRPEMEQAVRDLEAMWEWANPAGDAVLGQGFYDKLLSWVLGQ